MGGGAGSVVSLHTKTVSFFFFFNIYIRRFSPLAPILRRVLFVVVVHPSAKEAGFLLLWTRLRSGVVVWVLVESTALCVGSVVQARAFHAGCFGVDTDFCVSG